METDLSLSGFMNTDFRAFGTRPKKRILLREPERCCECNRIFISLYELKNCMDHENLDELF